MDIDLLAQQISNDAEMIEKVFRNIFSIECDDALRFDLNSLRVADITEFKDYHGVNVSIIGYLDRTKVPVSIDIGFGDVIYPGHIRMRFPVLLDMEEPEVYAYSVYSVIAEKFEAFVSIGISLFSFVKSCILQKSSWQSTALYFFCTLHYKYKLTYIAVLDLKAKYVMCIAVYSIVM